MSSLKTISQPGMVCLSDSIATLVAADLARLDGMRVEMDILEKINIDLEAKYFYKVEQGIAKDSIILEYKNVAEKEILENIILKQDNAELKKQRNLLGGVAAILLIALIAL